MRFRERDCYVQAERVMPHTWYKIAEWCDGRVINNEVGDLVLAFQSVEGMVNAVMGDWVVRDQHPTSGLHFHLVKNTLFKQTYVLVD